MPAGSRIAFPGQERIRYADFQLASRYNQINRH